MTRIPGLINAVLAFACVAHGASGPDQPVPPPLSVDAFTVPAETWSGSDLPVTIGFTEGRWEPGRELSLILSYQGQEVLTSSLRIRDQVESTTLRLPLRIGSGRYEVSLATVDGSELLGSKVAETVIRSRIESFYLAGETVGMPGKEAVLVPLDERPIPSPGVAGVTGDQARVDIRLSGPSVRETDLVLRLFIDDTLYASDYVRVEVGQTEIAHVLSQGARDAIRGRDAVLRVVVPYAESGGEGWLHLRTEGERGLLPKPMNHGLFVDRHGLVHPWEISHGHECIRDGQRYYPVGGMCDAHFFRGTVSSTRPMDEEFAKDVEMFATFLRHGINDVYFNLVRPPAWQVNYLLEYLDRIGIEYGFQPSGGGGDWMESYQIVADPQRGAILGDLDDGRVSALIPAKVDVKGFIVVPLGLPVEDLSGMKARVVSFSDAQGAASDAVVFDLDSADRGGMRGVSFELKDGYEGVSRVFLIPLLRERFHVRDLWSRMPVAQARLDRLKAYAWGRNFRFFVDPLVNEEGLYNKAESLRPYFPEINDAYAEWLVRRYGTKEALQEAWDCPGLDFSEASALIPGRVAGQRGFADVLLLIDPRTGNMRQARLDRSQAWLDFADMIHESVAGLKDDIVRQVKGGIDIPIVSKNVMHFGARYQVSASYRGIDGIGIDTYRNGGVPAQNGGGGALPMVDGSSHTMWLLTTEMGYHSAKGNGGVRFYPDYESFAGVCDELHRMGSRGFFFFGLNFFDEVWRNHSVYGDTESLEWIARIQGLHAASHRPADSYAVIVPGGYNYWWPVNRQTAIYDQVPFDFPLARTLPDGRWAYVSEFAVDGADVVILNAPSPPYAARFSVEFTRLLMETGRPIIYLGDRTDLGSIPALDRFFGTDEIDFPDGSRAKVLRPEEGWEVLTEDEGRPWAIRRDNVAIISRYRPEGRHLSKNDTRIPYLEEQWIRLLEGR